MMPAVLPCTVFGTVEDCKSWLDNRTQEIRDGALTGALGAVYMAPKGSPSGGSQEFRPPPQAGERPKVLNVELPADLCLCGHLEQCHRHGQPCFAPLCKCSEFRGVAGGGALGAKRGVSMQKRCVCADVGVDGSTKCSPEPHNNRVRFSKAKSLQARDSLTRVCDNHIQIYLSEGWVEVATEAPLTKVCAMCTNNEPLPGDTICEACAEEYGALESRPKNEAQRLKDLEGGFCINRDLTPNCVVQAVEGSQYCSYCLTFMSAAGGGMDAKVDEDSRPAVVSEYHGLGPRPQNKGLSYPRIRTIITSTRPCKITTGCSGNMTVAIYRYSPNTRPEAHWSCSVCRKDLVAARTTAVVDHRVASAQAEAASDAELLVELQRDIKEPASVDMSEMVDNIQHIRDIMHEQ